MTKIEWTDGLWVRFYGHVDIPIDGYHACWEWTAGRFKKGYGQFRIGTKKHKTHRLMWDHTYGPIPNGKIVCHTCDNPPCCRPSHLFLGTHADNARDRDQKGRGTKGRKRPEAASPGETNPAAILTEKDVREIRRRVSLCDGTYESLGLEYGVAKSTIGAVVQRRTWRAI